MSSKVYYIDIIKNLEYFLFFKKTREYTKSNIYPIRKNDHLAN